VTRRDARPKIVKLIMRIEYHGLAVRLEDQRSDGQGFSAIGLTGFHE